MDDLDIKIGLSKTNLLITISKMIVKANLKTTNELKRAGLREISEDLKYCLETIKTMEKELIASRQRNFDLERLWNYAQNEVKEQIKKNEELIKLL